MPKEIKMYEASDGKLFKSKQGAENYEKRIASIKKMNELNMDREEIQANLERIANHNTIVRVLLNNEKDWTKWPTHHIEAINLKLLKPNKTTIYVREYESWGNVQEEIIAQEEGLEFTDPELHAKNGEEYKVVKIKDVDDITRKVYYDYKYTWEERIIIKLESNIPLTESEINDFIWTFEEVYREEGEDRRWFRSILSVHKVNDKLFAVEWEQGLTENQENEFRKQPYEVELKTEEIVITKTTVVKK